MDCFDQGPGSDLSDLDFINELVAIAFGFRRRPTTQLFLSMSCMGMFAGHILFKIPYITNMNKVRLSTKQTSKTYWDHIYCIECRTWLFIANTETKS